MILTYSDHYACHLNKQGLTAIAVGNSIFDDWFKGKICNDEVSNIQKRFDERKKTILYLPTWNTSSSIDRYFESIKKLSFKCNLIVKLHHATFCGESVRVCKMFSRLNIITLGDYFDPLSLYKIADVILVDGVSGAFFDALLTKKRIIVLDISLDRYKWIKINTDKIHIPCVTRPEELENMIEGVFCPTMEMNERILGYLFNTRAGNAAERAVHAILGNEQIPALKTVEKYGRGIKNAPDARIKEEINKLKI